MRELVSTFELSRGVLMIRKIKVDLTKPGGWKRMKRLSRWLTSRHIKHYQAKGYDDWKAVYFIITDPRYTNG
jgi:hypothetical protein